MTPLFRLARREDVPALVDMLRDDALGAGRETTDLAHYLAAFDALTAEPGTQLVVGEIAGQVVATFQLTLTRGLSRQGAMRAIVEAVRVTAALRGQGIGALAMAEAERRARAAGAIILQLTSDATRTDAHRFYERLGYAPSHVGFKKPL